VHNHGDEREDDQEMNQSSGYVEDSKPESPRENQNDRQGREHKPFLQERMTAAPEQPP